MLGGQRPWYTDAHIDLLLGNDLYDLRGRRIDAVRCNEAFAPAECHWTVHRVVNCALVPHSAGVLSFKLREVLSSL